MGKKKEKNNGYGGIIAIPWTALLGLAEAMMYDRDIEECVGPIEEELFGSTDEWIMGRDKIFSLMTQRELEAYDLVENFVNAGKAGLPEDERSLEARIEHADWNNDDLRGELVHVLAAFESAIAYYTTVSMLTPDRRFDIADELEEIQVCIDDICLRARELELLIKIEEADFRMDEASIEMNDSYEEREILEAQLEALYSEFAENDDYEEIDVEANLDI